MTLVMSDDYLPGAMVLAHSLRDSGSTIPLVALVTLDVLSTDVIDELKVRFGFASSLAMIAQQSPVYPTRLCLANSDPT